MQFNVTMVTTLPFSNAHFENFQGTAIRQLVPSHNPLLSLSFTTKFTCARQCKNYIKLFSTFLDESREKPNAKFDKKEHTKIHLLQFPLFAF